MYKLSFFCADSEFDLQISLLRCHSLNSAEICKGQNHEAIVFLYIDLNPRKVLLHSNK